MKKHMISPAKTSTAECCLTKQTERQIIKTKIERKIFQIRFREGSFHATERIAIEYPTWREGQTPVLVSKE